MGDKPESAAGPMTTRKELAACEYARVLGTGPRRLAVAVPAVPPPDAATGAPGGQPVAWRPRTAKDATLLAAMRAKPAAAAAAGGASAASKAASGLLRLAQREPTWNAQLKCYQLDFDGRCTVSDDCNCILDARYAHADAAGGACAGPQCAFLLGRVELKRRAAARAAALGRDDAGAVRAAYSLDVGFPLSLTQAFGIALTQLNSSSIFDCR